MTPADCSIWDRFESLRHETVLADGPVHRVVRYAAQPEGHDDQDTPAIIGKFYRGDEGARTARIMGAISEAVEGSAASSVLGLPRALGYDAKRRLLLQEPAPGVRFDTRLSGPEALTALKLAGRALAALHGLEVVMGSPRHLGDHIRDLIRPHPGRLAQELPALAPRLDRILATLYQTETRWRGRRTDVPIHRDVHPKQLFLDGQRVCLIDWDLSTRGDAALDLGNLIAYLRARRRMDDAAVDALVGGYAVSGGADVLQRAPAYEALTYVRLSCKQYRLKEAGWREECAALIARAERCLTAAK